MSGAAREGWNVFSKWGRQVLWSRVRNPRRWKEIWRSREYLLKDSFGIFVCHAVGHSQQTFWAPQCEIESQICQRCFQPTGEFRQWKQ